MLTEKRAGKYFSHSRNYAPCEADANLFKSSDKKYTKSHPICIFFTSYK
jgi:hypothetical protein